MIRLNPKLLMWVFGVTAIAGVAIFLALYQSSPGPLSSPHARAIPGSTVLSCKQCHAEGGLTPGCLSCHAEIQRQLDTEKGYHAYLQTNVNVSCQQCHPEHLGHDFALVSPLAWRDEARTNFSHPHVEFELTGSHDKLTCEACHKEKRIEPFSLADFSDQQRASTCLGLNQTCISCHKDIHGNGERTKDCTACHDQNAFKPAPHFNHNEYFVLEGVHATTACADCHIPDADPASKTFDPVKGKTCVDCHETPHQPEMSRDCLSCHWAADESWSLGQRGIDQELHRSFGFPLDAAHRDLACKACHDPEHTYAERYPSPARQPNSCKTCHEDPHAGQFRHTYTSCLDCHYAERFMPANLGPAQHSKTYPLSGGHQAVACIQCHAVDEQTNVRQFATTPTECKACHENPHGNQFAKQMKSGDCTQCHLSDFTTFRIRPYTHQNMSAFFLGEAHANADCRRCHEETGGTVSYRGVSTECATCHQDIHRGQFAQNGATQCERCHDSTLEWSAGKFLHDRDSQFPLDGSHIKVACAACHLPVPQERGKPVVQYRPLSTRCEDCHAFKTN